MVLSNKEWLDKMDEIISAIQNGGGDSQVIEDMLSNMWISSATYNVGDYVLYNNNIWKCLVQNSNIAPSEGTTWTRVNITSEISTLNSNLSNIFTFASNKVTNVAISSGNISCYKNGKTVTINGFFKISKSGNIATIPTSFRPKEAIYCSIIGDFGNGYRTNIGTDGTIIPQNQLETDVWYTLLVTYVIG